MINSDKVIKIANGNNGYVTTKMIKESGIPTIELTSCCLSVSIALA